MGNSRIKYYLNFDRVKAEFLRTIIVDAIRIRSFGDDYIFYTYQAVLFQLHQRLERLDFTNNTKKIQITVSEINALLYLTSEELTYLVNKDNYMPHNLVLCQEIFTELYEQFHIDKNSL